MPKKAEQISVDPRRVSAQLLAHLAAIFAKPERPSGAALSAALDEALQTDCEHQTVAELKVVRDALGELAGRISERISWGEASPAERACALKEDAAAQAVLDAARRPSRRVMTTPKSIREGQTFMARAKERSAATTASLIARGELVSSREMQRLLNVQRQAISVAVKAGRLFAVLGPSGESFYPAFYADPSLDRRVVERVIKALGSVPAMSKLGFFTQKSTRLQETPLEALHRGRVDEVIAAATGFAER
jgi:hypothetical protein